jgi:hypothetical protein
MKCLDLLALDWQEQIFAEAIDAREPCAVGHDAMELNTRDPNALELDSMGSDTWETDAMDLYVGPEVLCKTFAFWAPLS